MSLVIICANLLGSELVWSAKSKGETLALKDALNPAGEAEEEEGKEKNQVWIFHFSTLLFFAYTFLFPLCQLVFVEERHDKTTRN